MATLVSYLKAGYSVIPVDDDKKPSAILSGRQWTAYQHQRPTPQEWMRWWEKGARGFAVVCGTVSGDLYGMDGDDDDYCRWLQMGAARALFEKTWVVRTCCGRIHCYLHSEIAVVTQILKAGDRKVADIRGNGSGDRGPSYLVAPPTFGRCSHNPSGGYYTTLHGAPGRVLRVRNALAVFQYLADQYAASQPSRTPSTTNGAIRAPEFQGAVLSHTPDIPPPLSPEGREALARKIRSANVSRKIQRVLFNGAVAGEGDWLDAKDDNSFIDFAVACTLLRAKFTDDEIVDCFATFKAGDFTFKNRGRPQHGVRYLLDYTLKNAHAAVAAEEKAADTATGMNFEVVAAERVPFDEVPMWHLTLRTPELVYPLLVKLKVSDFESDRSFKRAIWNQTNWMPELQGEHTGGPGFQRFMKALGTMATVAADLPEEASTSGYVKNVMLGLLRSGGVLHGSDDPLAQSLGWVAGDWVIIRSEILTSRMMGVMRISVPDIWRAFHRLGGQAETLEVAGKKTRVWILARALVGFEDE